MLTENHKQMFMKNLDITFMFEMVSMKNAHVVNYQEEDEGLYLTGARNVYTGHQYGYNALEELAKIYNIKVVQVEQGTLDDLIVKTKEYLSCDKEGWVLYIDGELVKLKCDDYVQIHKMLSKISSVNVIIQNLAEETYDDLISKVPENYRDRVQLVANMVIDWVKSTENAIQEWYRKAPKKDRKGFMLWVDDQVPKHLRGYVRQKYLGQEYNLLKKNSHTKCAGYTKFGEMGYDNKRYSVLFGEE